MKPQQKAIPIEVLRILPSRKFKRKLLKDTDGLIQTTNIPPKNSESRKCLQHSVINIQEVLIHTKKKKRGIQLFLDLHHNQHLYCISKQCEKRFYMIQNINKYGILLIS
jgi:hypothetical protein